MVQSFMRRMRLGATVASATALVTVAGAVPALAGTRAAPTPTWGTNGRVYSIFTAGDRLYVAGDFTAVVDASGRSYSAQNLAVFLPATGRFDLSWGGGTNGAVTGAEVANGKLYLGGSFTSVNGQPRRKLAAVDPLTGQLDPTWQPTVNNQVDSLAAFAGTVYIGGNFTQVNDSAGAHAAQYVARLDATSGRWDGTWRPTPDNRVRKVLGSADGSRTFLSGDFTTVSGAPNTRSVASINTSTGAVDRSFSIGAINGSARPPVFDMTTDGTRLLLAVGGQGGACTSVDAGTGATLWSKKSNGNLHAVAILGDTAYCGGHFSGTGSFDGQTRYKAAAVNLLSGMTLPFAPRINSALGVWEMATDSSNLYVGGDFTKINGNSQPHFAMFDGL